VRSIVHVLVAVLGEVRVVVPGDRLHEPRNRLVVTGIVVYRGARPYSLFCTGFPYVALKNYPQNLSPARTISFTHRRLRARTPYPSRSARVGAVRLRADPP
jgi:hypothetical protein